MLDLLPSLLVLLLATAYAGALLRLRRRYGAIGLPSYRVASFAAGLLVAAAALSPAMDEATDLRFSTHMLQHVLLLLVVSPLVALGSPLLVVMRTVPRRGRQRFATPVLRSGPARVLVSPLLGWTAFVAVLVGTHLPAVYDLALRHESVHALEHAAYLGAGTLFWSSIVGLGLGPPRSSYPARLLYLFLTMAVMAVLGEALASSDRSLYPYYEAADRLAGISAVSDQHAGGVLMWLAGTVTVVPAMAFVLLGWLAEDERRTVHAEMRQRPAGLAPDAEAPRR